MSAGMGKDIKLKNRTLVLLTVALGAMALIFASSLFFYVFYVCLILVLGSYLWVSALVGKLTLAREVRSDWVQVGDHLRERFTLSNDSRLGVLWAEVQDHSNVPGYEAGRVEAVGGRQYRKWGADAVCTRRGLYTLGPVTIRLGDPFGLFTASWEQPATRSFLVYPSLFELPGLDVPRGEVAGAARTSLRTQQITTNVATVRAYQPGDSLNRIHWPSTARLGSLMVKEFDLEPSGNLWIVLDLHRQQQAGDGDESTSPVLWPTRFSPRTERWVWWHTGPSQWWCSPKRVCDSCDACWSIWQLPKWATSRCRSCCPTSVPLSDVA
jgi:uncharacterized protein (DUF58 family)